MIGYFPLVDSNEMFEKLLQMFFPIKVTVTID